MKIIKILYTLPVFLLFYSVLIFLLAVGNHAMAETSGSSLNGVVKTPWVRRYPALVYIEMAPGTYPPPAEPIHISQQAMIFSPRLNPVLKGTTVDFTNDDTVVHNVFTPPGAAGRFNTGNYGVGVTKQYTFENLGVSTLLCSVHPEMVAYVIALQNPFYAVTDKKGNFKIGNVPHGSYTIVVWHEKLKDLKRNITIKGDKPDLITFEKKEFKKR